MAKGNPPHDGKASGISSEKQEVGWCSSVFYGVSKIIHFRGEKMLRNAAFLKCCPNDSHF